MSDQPFPVLYVSGAHYDMGLQHGLQVVHLRPALLASIAARQAQLEKDAPGPLFEKLVEDTAALLQQADPSIVAQIQGMADGLAVPRETLLRYNLAPVLRDVYTTERRLQEGCTTWAAAAPVTADGAPILAKTRDYTQEHTPLQVVVRAEPARGYRYTYLTSAGSPGVFVAGFNETGLSIVDTHVSSRDVGPGLPDYALAMHVLEQYDDVRSAIGYLGTMPRLGRNNVLLADSSGDIVAFEMGHRQYAVLEASNGFLVNTNHFNSRALRAMFVDTEPPALRGNTFQRYQRASQALEAAAGRVDVAFAKKLMAHHAETLDAICRHPSPQSDASTIAATIFLPRQRQMHVCLGQPCTAPYHILSYL